MRYCLVREVVNDANIIEYQEGVTRPGFAAWPVAFNGAVLPFRVFQDKADEFDLVHLVHTGNEGGLARLCKQYMAPEQTLVVSVDPAPVAAGSFLAHVPWHTLAADIAEADMVHCIDPTQKSWLEAMWQASRVKDTPPVAIFPHPAHVDAARKLKTDDGKDVLRGDRPNFVAVMHNQYVANLMTPALGFRAARALMAGREVRPDGLVCMAAPPQGSFARRVAEPLYDKMVDQVGYSQFLKLLSGCAAVATTNTYTNGSRAFQDACILGLPIVESWHSYYPQTTGYSERFPEMVVDPNDAGAYRDAFQWLYGDMERFNDVSMWLQETADHFDMETSRERMEAHVRRLRETGSPYQGTDELEVA